MSSKALLPSATPAAGLEPGTFEVDAAGQATYRLPIDVAPGLGGAQPNLFFTYNSSQRNGLLGVGWALSGLSVITRTKATYAVDGFNGAIEYKTRDRLMLDGQRLINIRGGYWEPNTLYYTELQSWNHVLAGADPEDGFTVCTRAGDIHEFGRTANSRIIAPGSTHIRVWALNATTDRHGNRVEYSYTLGLNPSDGAYYPDEIRYTMGNHVQPGRLVKFSYEERDPICGFVGGYPMTLRRRLSAVTVTCNGNAVRKYTLRYRISKCTQLSCLESITETGADGTSLLTVASMEWSDVDQPGFRTLKPTALEPHRDTLRVLPMSVDGSGRTDLVQIWRDENVLHATAYLAEADHDVVTYEKACVTPLGYFGKQFQILPADLTGNGLSDLLVVYADADKYQALMLAPFFSNGTGGFDAGPRFNTKAYWSQTHLHFFAMDVNGDGRTDLVEAYTDDDRLTFRSYLSQFGGSPDATFTEGIVTKTGDLVTPRTELAFWPMDVNGDGAMDLVRVWKRDDNRVITDVYISHSTALDRCSFLPSVQSNLDAFTDTIGFLPVDVNADGIPDLLQIWQDDKTLRLTTFFGNAAGAFSRGIESAFELETISKFDVMDLDGGGSPAVVSRWTRSEDRRLMFTVFRSLPSGAFQQHPRSFEAGDAVPSATFFAGDANGDGKGDLFRLLMDHEKVEIVPYLSSGPMPDLVTSITNALGGVVNIRYAPLTDASVYREKSGELLSATLMRESAAYPSSTPVRQAAPIAPTQFPAQAVVGQAVYVVAEYEETNDPALNRFAYQFQTSMSYAGAQINLVGRGWQGFARVTRTNHDDGHRKTRRFKQDYPETFNMEKVEISLGGQLVSASSSGFATYARGKGADGTAIYEVLKTCSRYEQYDTTTGAFDFALGETFSYDDYGCLIVHATLGYIDLKTERPLDPTEAVYRYASYINDVRADGWALGYVRYSKDSANAADADITKFGPGDYHLTYHNYTTAYEMEEKQRWDDVHHAWLTTSYTYDKYGNQITERKPGGATTITDYDPDFHTFRMRTISPPNEQGRTVITSYGFDPRFGTEAARQDANGFVTVTTYDAFGRKALVQGTVAAGTRSDHNELTPLVTGSADLRAVFLKAVCVTLESNGYVDDRAGGIYSQQSLLQSFPTSGSRNFVWNQTYVDGRTKERQTVRETGQSAGNAIVRTDYSRNDKIILQTAPFFSPKSTVTGTPYATRTAYDVLERPLTSEIPIGEHGNGTSLTTWMYASGGRVTVTSAAGSATPYVRLLEHHFYDRQDRVRAVTLEPAGANAKTAYRYDPIARLVGTIDPPTVANPNGVSNTIVWDSLDRRSSLDNPDQNTTGSASTKALAFAYDPSTGLPASRTDAAGATTSFTYDALGRMTGKAVPDGRKIAFTYDDPLANGGGLMTRATVTAGGAIQSQYDYVYDSYGKVSSVSLIVEGELAPFVTATAYDPQQRVATQILPDGGALSHTYAYAQLVSVVNGKARVDYPLEQMIPSQKPSRILFGPAAVVTTQYSFNPLGLLYHETVGRVIDVQYTYDALEQLRSEGEQAFTYGNRRLVAANVPSFDPASYGYDASGNLISKNGVSYTYAAHYPVRGASGAGEVFTAAYDACGRMRTRTSGGCTLQFAYDGLGCLDRVSNGSGTVREMLSDAFGVRLRARDSQHTILYVNDSYTVERPAVGRDTVTRIAFDDCGAVAKVLVSGGTSTIRYLRRDQKGSNTHAFDSSGELITEIAYSGYGLPRAIHGDVAGPTYEQRYWDAHLDLYYFGARYYDPVTGRFLTPDTEVGASDPLQPDALNRFAFELNNPINHVDADGHSVLLQAEGVLIGTVLLIAGVGSAWFAVPAVFGGFAIGAGINAVLFSATHENVSDAQFWEGWALNAMLGGVLGAATGGFGDTVFAYSDNIWVNLASNAAFGGAVGFAQQVGQNAAERWTKIDKDREYLQNFRNAILMGAIAGVVATAGVPRTRLIRRGAVVHPVLQELAPLAGLGNAP